MTPELIAAAERLADALAGENRALAALDFTRAAAMLEDKTRALEALTAAQAPLEGGETASGQASPRTETEPLAARLRHLAEENRRLLEHAIAVQGRVIALVARALPGKVAEQGGLLYGADGGRAETRPRSIALSARA